MKLLVGNLRYDTSEHELITLFGACGDVISVALPVDPTTDHIKGNAVVEMGTAAEAEEAMRQLHHAVLHGRRMRVRLAEEHELAEAAQKLPVRGVAGGNPRSPELAHRPERSPGR